MHLIITIFFLEELIEKLVQIHYLWIYIIIITIIMKKIYLIKNFYSLDELNEHVEVLPTEWNVTELAGESSCEFLINKVKKEDVIIRHFAGGQQWRKEWFDK